MASTDQKIGIEVGKKHEGTKLWIFSSQQKVKHKLLARIHAEFSVKFETPEESMPKWSRLDAFAVSNWLESCYTFRDRQTLIIWQSCPCYSEAVLLID
jgi:hypothetical protein